MQVLYKAYDGKIFVNRDDCIDYESKARAIAQETLLSWSYKKISGNDLSMFNLDGYDSGTYIVVDLFDNDDVYNALMLLFGDIYGDSIESARRYNRPVCVNAYDDPEGWEYYGTYAECLNACAFELHRLFDKNN